MITGDPYLLMLALVSMLLWLSAAADKDRWQWGYLACMVVSLIGAYTTDVQILDSIVVVWSKFITQFIF